jgi:hypothetical protein
MQDEPETLLDVQRQREWRGGDKSVASLERSARHARATGLWSDWSSAGRLPSVQHYHQRTIADGRSGSHDGQHAVAARGASAFMSRPQSQAP